MSKNLNIVCGVGNINQRRKLGQVLRQERFSKGMSIRELASITQISLSTISRIENGRTATSSAQLEQFVQALRIDSQIARQLHDLNLKCNGLSHSSRPLLIQSEPTTQADMRELELNATTICSHVLATPPALLQTRTVSHAIYTQVGTINSGDNLSTNHELRNRGERQVELLDDTKQFTFVTHEFAFDWIDTFPYLDATDQYNHILQQSRLSNVELHILKNANLVWPDIPAFTIFDNKFVTLDTLRSAITFYDDGAVNAALEQFQLSLRRALSHDESRSYLQSRLERLRNTQRQDGVDLR